MCGYPVDSRLIGLSYSGPILLQGRFCTPKNGHLYLMLSGWRPYATIRTHLTKWLYLPRTARPRQRTGPILVP